MTDDDRSRGLPEQLFLLAAGPRGLPLRPLPWSPRHGDLKGAVARALLAELALRGRILREPHGFHVIDARPTGDALLDALLARLHDAARGGWLGSTHALAQARRAAPYDALARRLVENGTLRHEERRVLGLVRRPVLLLDPGVEAERARALAELRRGLHEEHPTPAWALGLALLLHRARALEPRDAQALRTLRRRRSWNGPHAGGDATSSTMLGICAMGPLSEGGSDGDGGGAGGGCGDGGGDGGGGGD